MTAIDILLKQTKEAHAWTHKMIDSVPDNLWDETPDILESNISWQVGHLVISEYYHAILVIKGFDAEVTDKIDLKAHNEKYGYNSVPKSQIGTTAPEQLRKQLFFIQGKVMETIAALSDEDLAKKENIKVEWMDYSGYKEYEQLHPPFEHGVSILDLIFNEGPHAMEFMKSFEG